MMAVKSQILLQIKKVVHEVESRAEIIVFGSRARGDEHAESDWDVLILVPYATDLKAEQKFRHKLFDIELQFDQAISTLVTSKKEWESKYHVTPLYQNIMQEGIRL